MSDVAAEITMWGKFPYPHPGKNLGSGNRCGHSPDAPDWARFADPKAELPDDDSEQAAEPLDYVLLYDKLPKAQSRLIDSLERYYDAPGILPTLAHLKPRKNLDGTLRRNRSEGREADCLVMSAILRLTEFSTLRVGTPLGNGGFIPRSHAEIAQLAGLHAISEDGEVVASARYKRSVARLKKAGIIDTHQITVVLESGEKRARPAIKNVKWNFLLALGAMSKASLKKFRTWCTNELKKKRDAYAEKYPRERDAAQARNQMKKDQLLSGMAPGKAAGKKRQQPADQPSMQQQYSQLVMATQAELVAQKGKRSMEWVLKQLKAVIPPYDEWLKAQPG